MNSNVPSSTRILIARASYAALRHALASARNEVISLMFGGAGAADTSASITRRAIQRNGITTLIVVPFRGALSNSNVPFN